MTQVMRLPDFLIIGTMKSGTTSLYNWLGGQPEIFVPEVKEPSFFSLEDVWERGLSWYGSLFAAAGPGQILGEASVSYTRPEYSRPAAARISQTIPRVRLIYLLRHPVERIRSHYRHQLQRGRERRPFLEAISRPGNAYASQSLYYTCLEPFIERFAREQISIIRLEDLISPPVPGWRAVLEHVGIEHRPAPLSVHNVTGQKARFTRTMLWLWERGLISGLVRMPRPFRRFGKRLLLKRDATYLRRLDESGGPVPEELTTPVWEDVARLEEWMGRDLPLWMTKDPLVPQRSAQPNTGEWER
jgi:hypothetical protein